MQLETEESPPLSTFKKKLKHEWETNLYANNVGNVSKTFAILDYLNPQYIDFFYFILLILLFVHYYFLRFG